MKKSKRIKTLDRLSELPDSLIFSIFGLLPMRDVVATTILSKRWRDLWTTTPYLNFNDTLSTEAKFITPTLMFWRGTKILRLNIDSPYPAEQYLSRDVDLWVRFAKDYQVQEFYLHLLDVYSSKDKYYCVPQSLFSLCPSLKVLLLDCGKFHINRNVNVQWNQLTSLTVHTEVGLRCDDINRVLDGSPQLEVLVLRFRIDEHLTIRSTSLKKLSIDKYITCVEELQTSARLIICTPNLETLDMTNVPYFYCSLDIVSSLTNVSLFIDDCDYNFMNNSDSVANLFKQSLKQFHPVIQHVENVTLSCFCIKALGALIKKQLVPRLWDAKFLKLHSYFDNHKEIVDVLEFFSKVKMLVLEDASYGGTSNVESQFKFPPSFPNLMRVEVTWCQRDYSILALLEILLKYAGNLEKMVFRVKGKPSKCSKMVSQKLLRMERASSIAKLVFL